MWHAAGGQPLAWLPGVGAKLAAVADVIGVVLVAIAVEFRVGSVLACGASLILAVQLELFLPAGVGSLLLLCLLLDKLLLLLFDLSLFNDVLRALLEEADEMLVGGADLPVLVVERLTSILLAG